MRMMKRRKRKQPGDYPNLTVRMDAKLKSRIKAVAGERKMSFGQIVSQALRKFLPDLETK